MNNTIAKLKGIGEETFTIFGYQRSDGSVVNLTVKFMPQDGYKALVRESIRLIDTFGDILDKTYYEEVKHNVLESLNKALVEKSEEDVAGAPKRQSRETLEFISRNIAILDGNPDKVVAFNLEVISTETLVAPVKVTKSRDEFSANKKKLMAVLPVSRHCFRLNLYAGKYASIG